MFSFFNKNQICHYTVQFLENDATTFTFINISNHLSKIFTFVQDYVIENAKKKLF